MLNFSMIITIKQLLSQQQLTKFNQILESSNWLNGKRLPTSQNLVKLANILN